jgi:AraC-like DNA-binding protein
VAGAPFFFAETLFALTPWLPHAENLLPKRYAGACRSPERLMDVLSEVLRVVRLSGVVHFRAEFTRPWAIVSSAPEALVGRLKVAAGSVTPFHIVIGGACWVSCGKLPPVKAETGDVIVVPRGDQHVMTSDVGLTPVPIAEIYRQPSTDHIAVINYGGPGEAARFICGYLHSDQPFTPLLESLPGLIFVRLRNGMVTLEIPGSEAGAGAPPAVQSHEAKWWQATLDYFISEATVPGPGNRAVLARLSELLFMEVVRWHLRYLSDGRRGWLAALNDAQVGRAITLFHAEPARPWTVDELAQRVAMSRAAFANRFVELVGEPPMQYLTGWRMHLARRLLRDSTLTLAGVAGRVGYESEAAFNRAFRRLVGTPPATWRRAEAPADKNAEPTVATGAAVPAQAPALASTHGSA